MNDTWETDIAALLEELADVQSGLLGALTEKRQILATGDHQSHVTLDLSRGGVSEEPAGHVDVPQPRLQGHQALAHCLGLGYAARLCRREDLPVDAYSRFRIGLGE